MTERTGRGSTEPSTSLSLAGFWDRLTFVGRLLVTASFALVVAGSLMLYSSAKRDADEARADLRERLDAEMYTLPASLSELLVIGDFASLQQSLDRQIRRPLITKLVYRDESGIALTSQEPSEHPRAPRWFVRWLGLTDMTASVTAEVGGRRYGSLDIVISAQPAIDRAWVRLVEHMAILALAIILDFIGIWLVLRSGLRPLKALDAASSALGHGDLSTRVMPGGSPELRRTLDAFNRMAASIEDARSALLTEKERLQVTLASIGDAVLTTDAKGRVDFLNPVAESLTGWRNAEARGRPVMEVFDIVDEATRVPIENPVERVFREGRVVDLANHTLPLARDGAEHPIADSAAPIRAGAGDAIQGAILVFRDQSRERDYLNRLHDSEQRLNTILDNVDAAIYIKDDEYRYQYANRRACQLLGIEPTRLLGQTDQSIHDPATRARIQANDRRVIEGGERVTMEESIVDRTDGATHTFLSAHIPLRQADGRVYALCGVSTDITERKRAEEQLRLAASVFQHAQEGIIITDAEGRILDVNPAFTTLTGYSREEVLARDPSLLKSDRHTPEFFQHMWATLKETGSWRGEIWNRKKNGETFAELLAISAVPAIDDAPGFFVGVFSDITQLKSHQQHLERIAHFDALTQLPNRVLLADRLHIALAQARRSGEMLAVCYLDLDEFKPVNDTFGHERGDRLLVELASRLTLGLRAGDTVARLRGDEFVLLLGGIRDVGECQVTLERLLRLVATPCVIEGTTMTLSASIGVALFPQDNTDPDTLLRHADQSMYVAKEQGRNRYHLYDPEQDRRARAMRDALARMEQALADEEFQLYYQPKVDLRRGRVIGAEALIRWLHPERGLLPPSEFLPLIEDTDLAPRVGTWVIDRALGQMATWRAQGLIVPVSVNVSARHLLASDFLDNLTEAMARHQAVPPRDLELEILETSALDDLVHVTNLINACREHGVSFALDDFGTGYSSLSYLKRLPAQTLKIDQSFVRDMLRDSEDMAITGGIIGLADAFQRSVIAEGVEEIEHGVLLLLLGCDLAQGYAISRPIPAAELPNWMARWRPSGDWIKAAACRASKQDLPVILAMRDHRRWVAGIAAWLDQETDDDETRLPPLSADICRFSQWHDVHGAARYGAWPEYHAIAPLHRQVHALAEELVNCSLAGDAGRARERLAEIRALSEQLIAVIERLWARICA